jgi:hypothetical protein
MLPQIKGGIMTDRLQQVMSSKEGFQNNLVFRLFGMNELPQDFPDFLKLRSVIITYGDSHCPASVL